LQEGIFVRIAKEDQHIYIKLREKSELNHH